MGQFGKFTVDEACHIDTQGAFGRVELDLEPGDYEPKTSDEAEALLHLERLGLATQTEAADAHVVLPDQAGEATEAGPEQPGEVLDDPAPAAVEALAAETSALTGAVPPGAEPGPAEAAVPEPVVPAPPAAPAAPAAVAPAAPAAPTAPTV